MSWSAGALAAGCLTGVLAFDLLVVRPVVSSIQSRLSAAPFGERRPPAVLIDMLNRAYGRRVTELVAREALSAPPSSVEGTSTSRRQLAEAGLALLLPWHLAEADIEGAYLCCAYMGPEVHGFAEAARRYLGVELDRINLGQAAKLVALSHAPALYSESPERLERKAQQLLSRPLAGRI
jgi:hypothetical protein